MRIGHGYDAHRLTAGRPLIIGGVDIPHERGLLGHSDADVLTHAVIDALFGAAALGDIGKSFPDSDGKYKDILSLTLLEEAIKMVRAAGYEPVNFDATIIAQAPKLAPHIPQMRKNLAEVMGIGEDQINVKATTEEKMGFTGSQEGIAAHCVCLIA